MVIYLIDILYTQYLRVNLLYRIRLTYVCIGMNSVRGIHSRHTPMVVLGCALES